MRTHPGRPAVLAGAAALVLATPALAGAAAAPAQPDPSVFDIAAVQSVFDIDLSKAVLPLETEENSGGRVTVRISADVLFDFDKATLTSAAVRRIGQLAPRLRQATGTIEVSGHSDSVGDPGYNRTLSKKRADAVVRELQRAMGGSGPPIKAEGHGETKPVEPNEKGGQDNPEGRAKNRRVEISFRT